MTRWPWNFGELPSLDSRHWEAFTVISRAISVVNGRGYRNESSLRLHRVPTASSMILMIEYFPTLSDLLLKTSLAQPVASSGH